ncbi:MAG: prolyl oligopeptidase family serine peptidase [Bacteroidota bacterium]
MFEEKHAKYVEPEHGPVFFPNKQNEFLWYSERDGYDHLYRYNTEGTLLGQVTKGDWDVTEVLGFDAKGKTLFIQRAADLGLQRQVAAIDLKKGDIRPLTSSPGTHEGHLSPDGAHLLDTWSSTSLPYQALLWKTRKAELVDTLYTASDPLAGFARTEMKFFQLEADDGTPLNCRLILPPGFDSTRRYPVFYYLYGGPHAQLIQNKWLGGARTFLHYMAQRGYVVFTLDNRGSAHRGLAFEQATFRQLGTVEARDQMVGVNWLKDQPYVAPNRMAIHGWSYGGFMTINMMLRHPDAFQVAVCGGPVIDWNFYEVMYTERYMDTPEENPKGYAEAALQNHATNLKGDLMVIQGLRDKTVLAQHIYDFLQTCVDQDVQFDFFPYPRYEHHVRDRNRLHLLALMRDYVDERLKPRRRKKKLGRDMFKK